MGSPRRKRLTAQPRWGCKQPFRRTRQIALTSSYGHDQMEVVQPYQGIDFTIMSRAISWRPLRARLRLRDIEVAERRVAYRQRGHPLAMGLGTAANECPNARVTALPSKNVDGGSQNRRSGLVAYSHSIVPGGLLVTSSTTRLTSGTSLVIRVEILASTSYGTRVQSAVIASSEDTGRSTIG
jgi:hypothetical protein